MAGTRSRSKPGTTHNRRTANGVHGWVIAAFGRRFLVELAGGETINCVTHGKKGGIACGDHVYIAPTGPGQGVIESLEARTSLLYRADAFHEKIIAANVTQVIVVVAAYPSFYPDFVNRCLIAAEASELKILIVLNKSDMVEETATAMKSLTVYRDLGYTVLPLSAKQDISPLRPFLEQQTSVLVGQSGMGKSSIINALIPDTEARTAVISEALDSGRHTTTHARLYHLDEASHIIDSPGMQEFGLRHLSLNDITHAFVEFRPYLGQCKFANCKHLSEPQCAVQTAAASGLIDPNRLSAYRKIAIQHG
ncbi:MAG: ribosome small subunit-dependent GTPase A [Burkholderiales bacterium]